MQCLKTMWVKICLLSTGYVDIRSGSMCSLFAGFAFVTFESAAVVERVLEVHFHEINNKMVECKQAKPKEELSPPPSRGLYYLFLISLIYSSLSVP